MDARVSAPAVVPGERIADLGGHEWTADDQELHPDPLVADQLVLRVHDDAGIVQRFPMAAVFTRVEV